MTERRPRTDETSTGRTSAESPTADRPDAADPWARRMRLAVGLFLVGVLADVATTYVAITFGPFVEGSPVGRILIDRYGLVRGMIATKLAGMVLIALPVAVAKRNRTVVLAVMFGGVGAISVLAAVHNLVRIGGAL